MCYQHKGIIYVQKKPKINDPSGTNYNDFELQFSQNEHNRSMHNIYWLLLSRKLLWAAIKH